MKKIQIFSSGCFKCTKLEENVSKAVHQSSVECEIIKISDITEITSAGVMMMPAMAINGVIKVRGRVSTVEEIMELIDATD